MNETTHILGNFENALREARNSVLRMASIAEQNLENAVRALLTRNTELCNSVIAEDDEVNQLERRIDADSFEILMRYNPVAGDLREIITGMKVANNLERISDEAESIARRTRKLLKHPEVQEAALIEPLCEMAVRLFREAMRAYAEGNAELAMSLYARDRELDLADGEVIRELSKRIEEDSTQVKQVLHLIFIVRSLERVGDHSVNIGEDAVFLKRAEDIRHLGHKRAAKQAAPRIEPDSQPQ